MPELPEVETIARGLAGAVTGKTIARVRVTSPTSVDPLGAPLNRMLAGDRIELVGRRGKYVVLSLRSGMTLAVHLRMTGRLIVQPATTPAPHPYTRVRITFTDRTHLCFADTRKLGRVRIIERGEPWDR